MSLLPTRLLESPLVGGAARLGQVRLPLGGLAVGLLTGLTAQFLWPACIRACWHPEIRDAIFGERGDLSHLIDLYM